ncbi:hypothetical protein [Shivajiella indica]|uniref:Uncharacterized protein n=1 Tax=Shivajiella indica TaxID=872115 RepID=A0ABW5B410_9BACT
MKKIALIFVAFLVTLAFTNAQESGDLKGPAAKNYKPWKHQAKSEAMMVSVSPDGKKGPEFKNSKIWKEDSEMMVAGSKSKVKKTGPEAKNQKPWKHN